MSAAKIVVRCIPSCGKRMHGAHSRLCIEEQVRKLVSRLRTQELRTIEARDAVEQIGNRLRREGGAVMALVSIVRGCSSCPLAHEGVTSWGYQNTQFTCSHPDTKGRSLAKEDKPAPEGPPKWCPLRSSALVVDLHLPPKKKATP